MNNTRSSNHDPMVGLQINAAASAKIIENYREELAKAQAETKTLKRQLGVLARLHEHLRTSAVAAERIISARTLGIRSTDGRWCANACACPQPVPGPTWCGACHGHLTCRVDLCGPPEIRTALETLRRGLVSIDPLQREDCTVCDGSALLMSALGDRYVWCPACLRRARAGRGVWAKRRARKTVRDAFNNAKNEDQED